MSEERAVRLQFTVFRPTAWKWLKVALTAIVFGNQAVTVKMPVSALKVNGKHIFE